MFCLKKRNPISELQLNRAEDMAVDTRKENADVDHFVPIFNLDFDSEESVDNENEAGVVNEKGHSVTTEENLEDNSLRKTATNDPKELAISTSMEPRVKVPRIADSTTNCAQPPRTETFQDAGGINTIQVNNSFPWNHHFAEGMSTNQPSAHCPWMIPGSLPHPVLFNIPSHIGMAMQFAPPSTFSPIPVQSQYIPTPFQNYPGLAANPSSFGFNPVAVAYPPPASQIIPTYPFQSTSANPQHMPPPPPRNPVTPIPAQSTPSTSSRNFHPASSQILTSPTPSYPSLPEETASAPPLKPAPVPVLIVSAPAPECASAPPQRPALARRASSPQEAASAQPPQPAPPRRASGPSPRFQGYTPGDGSKSQILRPNLQVFK